MLCLACYLYFFSLQVLVAGFLLILKVYGIGFTNQLFANIFIDNQPFFCYFTDMDVFHVIYYLAVHN